MAIDYKLWEVVIRGFRGIDNLELELVDSVPSIIIGANNSGKSTVLNAIALALNGGGYHQWSPSETDFYCNKDGKRTSEFIVQVQFRSENAFGYPAVKGVGPPSLIYGVQVKGSTTKEQNESNRRTLLDQRGDPVTFAPRTALKAEEREFR